MKLVFLVDKQLIKRVDKNILISDSSDYVCVQFVFDSYNNVEEMWDSAQAIFWKEEKTEYVDLDGISGECLIPDKFLGQGSFKISLLLRDGSRTITTNQVIIEVKPSGFELVYKPDAYSRLIEKIDMLEKITGNISITIEELTNRIKLLEGDQNDNVGEGGNASEPINWSKSEK